MSKIYRAKMVTRHYDWEAFDLTEKGARHLLLKLFQDHLNRAGLSVPYGVDGNGDKVDEDYGLFVEEVEIGKAYVH